MAGNARDTVAVPRWAADLAANPNPRICSVCLGLSPSSDGHDRNPPCIGAAREAIREAVSFAVPPMTVAATARMVCGKCGAKSDKPGVCWTCFDRAESARRQRHRPPWKHPHPGLDVGGEGEHGGATT